MPLFYQNVVPLDRRTHARLKIRPPENYANATDVALLPVLSTEFGVLAREYPLVFMRENEKSEVFVPVVLTGMPQGKNLFLDGAGVWQARYIPAYVRRYPFVFVETAADNFTVCIDDTSKLLDEKVGTPLFGEDGEPTNTMKDIVKSLSDYQQVMHLTKRFMQHLADAKILVEGNAKAEFPDGRSFTWRGFWMVDEARFRELPEATLKEWFKTGELGLVYAHLLSLGNIAELLRRHTNGAVAANGKAP